MNCSCNVSNYDSYNETYWHSRKLKAAKVHKCCECGKEITKGDYFFFESILDPEEVCITNFKVCEDCSELCAVFFQDGWRYHSVLEDLQNYLENTWFDDLPSECISQLSPVNRDRVCDILQLWQDK